MNDIEQNDLIRRYLLGGLADDDSNNRDREFVEKRLFEDNAYLEWIAWAEDDLIDDYVNDAMSKRDRELFESRFLLSSQRRERTRFAWVLREKWRKETQLHGGRAWLAFRGGRIVISSRIAAGVTLAIAIGFLVPLHSLWTSHKENDSLRQAAELARNARPAEQGKPAEPVLLTLDLAPGTTRADQAKVFRIPLDGPLTEFRLHIERPSGYVSYRARLQNLDGEVVWTEAGLTAVAVGNTVSVGIRVPSRLLPDADYVWLLQGVTGTGVIQPAGDFSFRVIRK